MNSKMSVDKKFTSSTAQSMHIGDLQVQNISANSSNVITTFEATKLAGEYLANVGVSGYLKFNLNGSYNIKIPFMKI